MAIESTIIGSTNTKISIVKYEDHDEYLIDKGIYFIQLTSEEAKGFVEFFMRAEVKHD